MTLREYLTRPDALPRAELCEALGITAGRLSQLNDITDWPPALALKLEDATGGAVSASDISSLIAKARTA